MVMSVVAPPPISSSIQVGQKQQKQQEPHHHLLCSSGAARTTGTILSILLRISLICHLLLLYLLPKKVRSLLPHSWLAAITHDHHHPSASFPVATARAPPSAAPPPAPSMDPQELKRVFQMFDRNGDGRITKKELSDSLDNLGIFIPDSDLVAMIEKIDVNRDGCVDLDEFGELYQTIMDEKDEEEDVREAFNVFDQNGDGFITVEELRSVLASLGLKQGRSIDDCRKMIKKVDVDGDGMIDFKEFKQMMRGGGFAALT